MNINQTMHPKAIIIFKLISLEPINFTPSICFLSSGNFSKIGFSKGNGSWVNAVTGIASGVNRQTPTINHRAPLRLSNKKYYWAIGTKSFFLNCTQHNSQNPSEIPLWLIALILSNTKWVF